MLSLQEEIESHEEKVARLIERELSGEIVDVEGTIYRFTMGGSVRAVDACKR